MQTLLLAFFELEQDRPEGDDSDERKDGGKEDKEGGADVADVKVDLVAHWIKLRREGTVGVQNLQRLNVIDAKARLRVVLRERLHLGLAAWVSVAADGVELVVDICRHASLNILPRIVAYEFWVKAVGRDDEFVGDPRTDSAMIVW